MAFTPLTGRWVTEKYPTKAAVTYTQGMFLYSDNTDNVPVVDASQSNIIGIAKQSVASSATTTMIHVDVASGDDCLFLADLESGETITSANVGDSFDFADGALTISTASTYDTVRLVKYISSSQGVFKLNKTHGIEN